MEWTKLFPTAKTQRTVVDDIEFTNLPLPPQTSTQTGGADFNIVLVVEEHAPARLIDIYKQVAEHEEKIKKLKVEAAQLRRLLAALNTKTNPSK